MVAAVRLLAVAVLSLALLPAAAPGATVDRDTETGVITIVDREVATADDITVERTPTLDVISRVGGDLINNSIDCDGGGADPIECPLGTSLAVDLGEGDDTFSASTDAPPISVAGGIGNDEIATGDGDDVLAGGEGDDLLNGGLGVDD